VSRKFVKKKAVVILPFPCKLCVKTFESELALAAHVRNEHAVETRVLCEQCGATIPQVKMRRHKNQFCKGRPVEEDPQVRGKRGEEHYFPLESKVLRIICYC
jgi:hypothetical protein